MYFPNGLTGIHAPRRATAERKPEHEYATVLLIAAAVLALVLLMRYKTAILKVVVSVCNMIRRFVL